MNRCAARVAIAIGTILCGLLPVSCLSVEQSDVPTDRLLIGDLHPNGVGPGTPGNIVYVYSRGIDVWAIDMDTDQVVRRFPNNYGAYRDDRGYAPDEATPYKPELKVGDGKRYRIEVGIGTSLADEMVRVDVYPGGWDTPSGSIDFGLNIQPGYYYCDAVMAQAAPGKVYVLIGLAQHKPTYQKKGVRLYAVDTITDQVVREIMLWDYVGSCCMHLWVASDRGKAYAISNGSMAVRVIDTTQDEIVKTIHLFPFQ